MTAEIENGSSSQNLVHVQVTLVTHLVTTKYEF